MSIKEWLSSNLKMKRWILLMILGVFLISYGLAKIFSYTDSGSYGNDLLNIPDIVLYAASFIMGIVCTVIAFIMSRLQVLKAIAEPTIRSTQGVNIKKLLYDKTAIEKGIKIVVIGGGSGLAPVLRGLKEYSSNITAIVNTAGGGYSEDIMTKEFGILPPNDIRQSLVALSNQEEKMQQLMRFKFKKGILKGQNFANLLLIAMNDICDNNFAKAIKDTSDVLSITGKVLPITLDRVNIGAVLKDGSRVVGDDNITDKVFERNSPIEKIFLEPASSRPAPEVIKSIREADLIVIGPGSLYTGIIPTILLKEVADNIRGSKAIKVFVANIMSEPGQTDNYKISDLINSIHEHVGGKGIVDYCLANESNIMPEYIRSYNKEGSELLEIDKNEIKTTGVKLIIDDFAMTDESGYIRHDPKKLARSIMTIAYNNMDLKHNKNAFEAYRIKLQLTKSKKKKKSVLFQPMKVVMPSQMKSDSNKEK